MPPSTANPLNVRVGPGVLYIAALDTPEPADLTTPWDGGWVEIGYTDAGSNFVFDQTFANVEVAEELDPILVLQTARQVTINFAAAELTADNLTAAFNGGDVTGPTGGVVTFEPPDTGDFTPVMLGWESDDALERWVFRKSVQVGNIDIARRKAPAKSTIPMSFRCVKPAATTPAFIAILDADFVTGS